jgi:hypothetical protein
MNPRWWPPGLKFDKDSHTMKKKETLWQLLRRLDEQAGQFNYHLSEANRYFDVASTRTREVLVKHEQDLHQTIGKIKKLLKKIAKKKKKKEQAGKDHKQG